MRKRGIAILLAALICAAALPIGSGMAEAEPAELLFVNTLFSVSDDDLNYFYNSPVYAELTARTGVTLTIRGADADQAAIYFASGDLGDITNIRTQSDIASVVESEMILPLNELVETYAPNITAYRPERWETAKTTLSTYGDGVAHVLPIRAGAEGFNYYPGHNLFYIRWDLYADMGYPEVKNETDFLNVLADMYENNKTTAEGLPAYAVGFYASTTDIFPFYGRLVYTYGYRNLGTTCFHFDVDNGGALVNAFVDPVETFSGSDESLFFAAAKYFNQAYRMGLLDPDSFTQQAADYTGKCSNGQYISGYWRNQADVYVNTVLANDPESTLGFQVIPIDGMTLWSDTVQAVGWENFYLALPASAKSPEASIKYIDYLFSPEGARLLFSGVEGQHWNVVDGAPVWTDEVIALKKKGGAEWSKTGIYFSPILYAVGLGNSEIYEADGGPLDLQRGDDYLSKCLKPVDVVYCERYGAKYPLDVFFQMKEEGRANTHREFDMRIASSFGSAPDEIFLLNSSVIKTAVEAIPSLVMAQTDEEFQAIKAELLTKLDSIGLPTVREWYEQRYAEVMAALAE